MNLLIDENFGLHAKTIPALEEGMHVAQMSGFTYTDCGLSCDTFNIIHIHSSNIDKAEFQFVINHFQSKSFDFCVWVNQENLSKQTQIILDTLQLSIQNQEVGMVLDLESFQDDIKQDFPNVLKVTSKIELEMFASVLASNWSPADQNVIAYYNKTSHYFLQSNIDLFFYKFDGTPCTTVELFPTDSETAGIYGLATLESFRGRGIGKTLMSYLLNHAKKSGYKNLILQATEDGIGIYRKLGFKPYTTYYEFA